MREKDRELRALAHRCLKTEISHHAVNAAFYRFASPSPVPTLLTSVLSAFSNLGKGVEDGLQIFCAIPTPLSSTSKRSHRRRLRARRNMSLALENLSGVAHARLIKGSASSAHGRPSTSRTAVGHMSVTSLALRQALKLDPRPAATA